MSNEDMVWAQSIFSPHEEVTDEVLHYSLKYVLVYHIWAKYRAKIPCSSSSSSVFFGARSGRCSMMGSGWPVDGIGGGVGGDCVNGYEGGLGGLALAEADG